MPFATCAESTPFGFMMKAVRGLLHPRLGGHISQYCGPTASPFREELLSAQTARLPARNPYQASALRPYNGGGRLDNSKNFETARLRSAIVTARLSYEALASAARSRRLVTVRRRSLAACETEELTLND